MRRVALLLLVVVFAAVGVTSWAQVRAEVALRAATELETVKGDLKGAIEAYKKIADGYPEHRSIRAQALVRMADCYHKLGDAQAARVYERILREFSDQKDAVAIAQSRATKPQPSRGERGLTMRRIYSHSDVVWDEAISPDGTTIAFVDLALTGTLVVRDVATGKERRVTREPQRISGVWDEYPAFPLFSPDGKQLAYTWCTNSPKAPAMAGSQCGFVRIARIGGGESDPPRALSVGAEWTQVYDWSLDGKWLAVLVERTDKTRHIGVLSVTDGSLRLLKSLGERNAPDRMAFSPDGRYVAYDSAQQLGATITKGDVFLLQIENPIEQVVASGSAQDRLAGWAPDGSGLLFTSDRTQTTDLYAAPITQGKVGGAVLLKSDLGDVFPLDVTATGTMYYSMTSGGGSDVQLATFDYVAGRFLSVPVRATDAYPGTNQGPRWSPDGKWLSYISRRRAGMTVTPIVVLRSRESGEVRELRPNLSQLGWLQWLDDASLVALGNVGEAEPGIFRIDAQTGKASVIVRAAGAERLEQLRLDQRGRLYYFRALQTTERFMEFDLASGVEKELLTMSRGRALPSSGQISPDGARMYYRRPISNGIEAMPVSTVVERDIASGAEKALFEGRFFSFALSPDGKYLAVARDNQPSKGRTLMLIPTSGGAPRALMPIEEDVALLQTPWAPDSRSVFLLKRPEPQKRETWWAPIDGGAPQRLPHLMLAFAVHPDQKQIAMSVGSDEPRKFEIWAMDNFLTPAGKK